MPLTYSNYKRGNIMGFFSKDKKEEKSTMLPELPGMPKLPELPTLPEKNSNYLPPSSISSSNMRGLQAIKDSINEKPQEPGERRTIEISDLSQVRTLVKAKEPLFIKIDKFQEAVEKFEEVKKKVSEIEDSLKKIKDIKEKEDLELRSWEDEARIIKEKVANIDSALFNKL